MDEVDAIEQRALKGFPARTQRLRVRQAMDDVLFLVRAVRSAEKASRGFIEAICRGVLVPIPDPKTLAAYADRCESGDSLSEAARARARDFAAAGRPVAAESPVLNKSGGSDVEGRMTLHRLSTLIALVGLAVSLWALVGCGSVNSLTVDAGDAAGGGGGAAAGGRGGAELGGASGAAAGSSGGALVDAGGADARPSCGTEGIAYDVACGASVDGLACVSGCRVGDAGVAGCTAGARYCIPAGASCGDGCR